MGKLLLFQDEVTVCFPDIRWQHLQFGLLHLVEWVMRTGDLVSVIGVSEGGGFSTSFSFALVRDFARFFDFLSPSFGQGMVFFSFGVGLITALMSEGLI